MLERVTGAGNAAPGRSSGPAAKASSPRPASAPASCLRLAARDALRRPGSRASLESRRGRLRRRPPARRASM